MAGKEPEFSMDALLRELGEEPSGKKTDIKSELGLSDSLFDEILSMTDEGKQQEGSSKKAISDSNPIKPVSIDAEPVITIGENKLEASIFVKSPAFGGAEITLEAIKEAIDKKKIVYGIDEDLLENIVTEKIYNVAFTFAYGEAPTVGKNGYVEPLYDEVRKLKPKILEDGSVDFKDLDMVINVHVGDPICKIFNETIGEKGKDVFGEDIPAGRGDPPNVPEGNNTGVNGDGSLLVALADGNLIFNNGKFMVETLFVVRENVDISTGNIHFIGSIEVKGNVDEGFTVESSQNITVWGMVNGATLKAKGDIIVKNGSINSTIISEQGNVTVGFGETSKVRCKGVFRANSVIASNISCEGDLECINMPGTVVGGEYNVTGNMSCNTLGHRNYISTIVSVGECTRMIEESAALEKRRDKIDSDIKKIARTVDILQDEKNRGNALTPEKAEFMSAAIRLKIQKTLEKKPITKRLAEIENHVESSSKRTLKVNRTLHPNVTIKIVSVTLQTTKEYGRCVAYNNGEKLIVS